MCVNSQYMYFPESCEKLSQACYSGVIRTYDPCNSRAVSYQQTYEVARYLEAVRILCFGSVKVVIDLIKSFVISKGGCVLETAVNLLQ